MVTVTDKLKKKHNIDPSKVELIRKTRYLIH